ncbi:MAG TPA: apolipoprotein N-acyltransferase [Candidatus Binatia bacterium]|jgi:apolipoprotein N-acyltransferase
MRNESSKTALTAARNANRARALWLLLSPAALSAALLAAPFLNPVFFPAAWAALVPLFWLVRQTGRLRDAFLVAWLMGALAHLLGFYWIEHTARVFGGFPHGLSEIILLGFSFLAALPIAFFGLFFRLCGLGPLRLYPALLWVAIEFLWPQIFPWYLANTQSQFLGFIQSADVVGLYAVSFLLVWFNTVAYAVLFHRERGLRAFMATAAFLSLALSGNLFYGGWRFKGVAAEMGAARTIDIVAIQGNVGIELKWNAAYAERNLKTYLDLTRKAPRADLYLWPESTVETWVPDDAERLPAEILPPLPAGSSLIFGTISFTGRPNSPGAKVFNTTFLIDADGRVRGRYHKQVLLAFGEYIPFEPILSKIPGMPPIGGIARGAGSVTLDLTGGVQVAPLICYEDIMPELARRFVNERGANLLVNFTNDAWFGNTIAPWQHARLSQWRAIETRRNLVRVTNTGATTIVSPKGEMLDALPVFSSGVLAAKVEIMEGETLYVKYGDWFGWSVSGLALAVVLLSWRRRKQTETSDQDGFKS